MGIRTRIALALLACAALLAAAGPAQAQRWEAHGREWGRGPAPVLHLDSRYGHDHYYPPHGFVVPALPAGSVSVSFGGGQWFFHGGVWFRPSGPRFIVSVPPVGIFVPLLPPAYATVWVGGLAYYYANGTYYTAAPGGYTVVAPPPGADAAQPLPPAPPPVPLPEPIVYPRNGQSPAQQATDRQDCDRWAGAQPNAAANAGVFQRAQAACLDGRGYTVR